MSKWIFDGRSTGKRSWMEQIYLTKDKSTPENREYWEFVEKTAAEVATWPEWKTGREPMDKPCCERCGEVLRERVNGGYCGLCDEESRPPSKTMDKETTDAILERMEKFAEMVTAGLTDVSFAAAAQNLADVRDLRGRLERHGLIESPALRAFMDQLKDLPEDELGEALANLGVQ